MLRDSISYSKVSQDSFNLISSGRSITSFIEFIKSKLPKFISEAKSQGIRVEKGLNHLFVRIMDTHELYQFIHEDLEEPNRGNSAAIDIGIYTRGSTSTRFFAIEGKRLDTTMPNYSRRKKEYVVNNNGGGIERFKKNIHGKDLLVAGMIGYVQTDDFNIWEQRINCYIKEEIKSSTIGIGWNKSDLLINDKLKPIYATYASKHIRASGNEIDLYHLWVDLQ